MPGILQELGIESAAATTVALEEDSSDVFQFDPREQQLELAAAELERIKAPAADRIKVWLELADLHRSLALHAGPQKRARLKQAEIVVRKALEIAARAKDTVAYLACLDAMAEVFDAQKNYGNAEKVLQEGIRLEAALPHPDMARMARRVRWLGVAQHRAGKLDIAVPVLERAIKLHETIVGSDHDDTMAVLVELGSVHRARGRKDFAASCFHHALRYYQRSKGVVAPEAMETLSRLVSSYEESNEREKGGAEYERVLLLLEREIGRDLDEMGEMQYSVASIYMRWGNYTRARELLGECLGTFRRLGGARLAVAYETLAHVEENSGHFPDAVRELANAGKVWAKLPDRKKELIANMNYRADLLEQLKRKKEAAWLREQVAQIEKELQQSAIKEQVAVRTA
jgi:tetratricopeptide (TPR) repeat protein